MTRLGAIATTFRRQLEQGICRHLFEHGFPRRPFQWHLRIKLFSFHRWAGDRRGERWA